MKSVGTLSLALRGGRILRYCRQFWYYVRMGNLATMQQQFADQLACPCCLHQLFECLPDTYFYAKNAQGQFVMANQALAELLGLKSVEDLVGRTDHDLSPADLADQYVAEDQHVMRTGEPVTNQSWLVADHRGALKWYLSSKVPLFGDDRKAIGIAGAMRDIREASALLEPFRELDDVVDHVVSHYADPLDVRCLARRVNLSISQFDRRFKRFLQMTPQEFILRVRVHAARRMLVATDKSIADIALDTGFCDQSYFTKQFKRQTGMPPSHYRRAYQDRKVAATWDK